MPFLGLSSVVVRRKHCCVGIFAFYHLSYFRPRKRYKVTLLIKKNINRHFIFLMFAGFFGVQTLNSRRPD